MLSSVVDLALRQRLVVLLAALGLTMWGAAAYVALPIDAFPDVSPTQVLVSIRAPGLTPEELESRVTQPTELAMKGIPNLVSMRSTTRYSVALMTFEFADGTDIFWARNQVNERLAEVQGQLPPGVSGGLAPIVTPLGEMLMFAIEGGGLDPQRQRHLIDWTIRPALRGLPGVADVNVLGGFVRTFEVVPNPDAMAARGITIAALTSVLESNNANDGAGRVLDGEEALLVRAEGRIQTLEDIRAIVVASRQGGIVRVGDVADVRIGALARNGIVVANGDGEAVWGTVLGLRGANARTVVEGVKSRLEQLKSSLPDEAKVVIFYDRSALISSAIWTIQKVLIEAIVLVVALLLLFLGGLRAAIVVSLILPMAVLCTFGLMRLYGLSANIMSLGGLAIAIGLLVDCAVVVVENVSHRLSAQHKPLTLRDRITLTGEATREVMVPLISGVIIIVTVFLPLLSLQGLEGRMFAPVALTIAFALSAALLLSLTVVPTLCTLLLRDAQHGEPWLVRKLHAAYDPFLHWVIDRPWTMAGAIAIGLLAALVAYVGIGSIFVPSMDEGSPVLTVRKHHSVSLDETAAIDLRLQRELMQRVPEIRAMRARSGADELGLDPVGLNETDMFLTLAPRETWRGPNTAWLLEQMRAVLDDMPGISYSISQPIEMRVQEMVIGARGDLVLKAFGPDLTELNRIVREAAEIVRRLPGASDVFALRNEGMKYLTIRVDRLAAGRSGLNAADVQKALRVWVDGAPAGIVLEGEVRTPLIVRGEESLRRSANRIGDVPIVRSTGDFMQLSQIAELREEEGPVQVAREQAERVATMLANVQGRDLVGFVDEARAAVSRGLKLPPGYRLEWGGQFENQQRASARLAIVVPVALGLILLLLYLTFNSLRQAVLVFCNVPFAAIGGVIALRLSGEYLSVPASVGFIALIGIAILNGVVLISYINRLIGGQALDLRHAVLEGAKRRMTPVLLTATIAAFGLVPFLFADGPGAEIQRPLAVVVIGGLVSATTLTLLLLPLLYDRFAFPTRPTSQERAAHYLSGHNTRSPRRQESDNDDPNRPPERH